MQHSLVSSLMALPELEIKKRVNRLSQKEAEAILYDWAVWSRPNQRPPAGSWLTWLMMAGRGFGKTRAGAEFIRSEVEAGKTRYIALVGKTPADVRDVMIEGESGLLKISPPWFMPKYESSKRRLTWPNGAYATTFSSYEPDQLRGPQHDLAWVDELRTFAYVNEVWDNLMLGLRLGSHPRVVVTTTPAPLAIIRNLIKEPTTVVTKGTTYENRAFLAESFFGQVVSKYAGTRLGRQEINAELLEDVPGALWKRADILYKQVPTHKEKHDGQEVDIPELQRVVVAIDPAVTSGEGSDETGIVVAAKGIDGYYYILADRSARATPDAWARRAIQAYRDFSADRIIGETNNGGEMIQLTLRTVDRDIPFKAVHASRGKQARAEPISALYEQHKVFHTTQMPDLEDQLLTWTPESGESPDRLDALVWAMTELSGSGEAIIRYI